MPSQIRAARAALGWSADDLASASGISRRTIGKIENSEDAPSTGVQTLLKLQSALEAAGIEFIGTPDDGPGIRIRTPRP
ncbi:MAG: helix-turn-helix domain-containing protein [Rhodobacteraceae bacterium]|nr:helix-turn-helix domain-containing protein [Paracoccaceae bacterium]